jgi:hypothetical protein
VRGCSFPQIRPRSPICRRGSLRAVLAAALVSAGQGGGGRWSGWQGTGGRLNARRRGGEPWLRSCSTARSTPPSSRRSRSPTRTAPPAAPPSSSARYETPLHHLSTSFSNDLYDAGYECTVIRDGSCDLGRKRQNGQFMVRDRPILLVTSRLTGILLWNTSFCSKKNLVH